VEARKVPLDGLDERQRKVVCAHFGLDRPRETLREIANELGLSAERVRQIEQHALEELRTLTTAG
jgi:RNA polymerase sigma factor (sigma-70 family)